MGNIDFRNIYKIIVTTEDENGNLIRTFENDNNFSLPIQLENIKRGKIILIDKSENMMYVDASQLQNTIDDILEYSASPIEINTDKKIPSVYFEDISEVDMFDFDPIKESDLRNKEQGLWINHGKRRLKFTISNLIEDIRDIEETEFSYNIVFNKKNNDFIEEIRFEDIFINTNARKANTEVFGNIDTNLLGREFVDEFEKLQRLELLGSFELTVKNRNSIQQYSFPISINIHNTEFDTCKLIDKKPVSIDFGTSSTCVAVKDGTNISLLTLSSEELERTMEGVNKFENPTNLMIYRWEEIYKEWTLENHDTPY
ncbi:MAG: hypothetical protein R3Y64_10790, partial [Peptostreptococcaceae bacterium]